MCLLIYQIQLNRINDLEDEREKLSETGKEMEKIKERLRLGRMELKMTRNKSKYINNCNT